MFFSNFVVTFKQGFSKGAASGGSDFRKMAPDRELYYFLICFVTFKQGSSRGAASGGSDFWKIAVFCTF